MYLAILVLPLLGGLVALYGPVLSVIAIVTTAILSTIALFEVGLSGSPVSLKLGDWIHLIEFNTVSMLIPVIYFSFFMLILGWEGVGGILLCISMISDLSMASIFSLASYLNGDLIFLLSILLLIGATAKSAQLGLHSWLASAMEGPTPVSALIHAATMVTAGEWSSTTLISALFGAACGLLENDLKKVIAFSTTSQLVACGLSQYSIALFHLSLLFLSAGAVIHALADEQDMRKMGSLVILLPKTYRFYSKDYLLELALIPNNATTTIAYLLALMILTFLSAPHWSHTGLGSTFYQNALFTHPSHLLMLDAELAPLLGVLNHFNIWNHWVMQNTLTFANSVFRYWDRGLLEFFGPMGCAFQIELLATGFIPHYALITLLLAVSGFG
ncbi:NADH dehydrogenase subunit 5 [Phlyctochytrium arcticum]|nr:NADH dehydrogenase subunit 5 [Phlyctochytrium arcticum]